MLKKYRKYLIPAALLILGIILGNLLCRSVFGGHCGCGVICGALNSVYEIEGRLIKLENGVKTEQLSPNSSVLIRTQIEKIPVKGTLRGKNTDAAVLITQTTGSEGVYYYIAAALGGKKTYGSNAVGLGDRIVPLGIEIENEIIYVTFLDRASGTEMDSPANVQITRMFTIQDNVLRPVG